MKQLSDEDIYEMINKEFLPDEKNVKKRVRKELNLYKRIPSPIEPLPERAKLDLHQLTEEQAWQKIMELAQSGIKHATIITGASGILHKKFPQWVNESILSPYIISATPINNGSFNVIFKKQKN